MAKKRAKVVTKKQMNWRYEETLPCVCKFDKQHCTVVAQVQNYQSKFPDVQDIKATMIQLLEKPTTAEHFAEALSDALGRQYVVTIKWSSPTHGPIEIIA